MKQQKSARVWVVNTYHLLQLYFTTVVHIHVIAWILHTLQHGVDEAVFSSEFLAVIIGFHLQ